MGAGELRVQRLHPDARVPTRAHDDDAGLDLCALEAATLQPGERATVRTGIAIALAPGHAGLVLPRSGLAARHGIAIVNAPGLIDAGYRGEVICAVVNLDHEHPVKIAVGDRIAQLVVVALPSIEPVWVEELPPSARGVGGFGSTGAS